MDIRTRLFQEDKILSDIEDIARGEGFINLKNALPYMKKQHEGQFRKKSLFSEERVPYINHPLTMAYHAYSLGVRDDELLSAILLHDVVEDTGAIAEEMPVSREVQELVKLLSFSKPEEMTRAEAKKLYYGNISGNIKASLIKMIDRCNNVSTMAGSFSFEKMEEYIEETEKYILPLGDKIGEQCPEYAYAVDMIKYQIISVIETIKCLCKRTDRGPT